MVSQLDYEYFEVMRDIEGRRAGSDPPPLDNRGHSGPNAGSARTANLRRVLPYAVIVVLISTCLYMAYLAGILGTVGGQSGLWRALYGSKADQYEALQGLYSNQSGLLVGARDERDQWEARAEGLELELDLLRSTRDDLERMGQETESALSDALREKEEAMRALEESGKEGDEWRTSYLLANEELDSLRARYTELEGQLDDVVGNLGRVSLEKGRLEGELNAKAAELVKVQISLALLHLKLGKLENEKDQQAETIHQLELVNQGLVFDLRLLEDRALAWKRSYQEEARKVDRLWAQVNDLSARVERLMEALESTTAENAMLRRIQRVTAARLESALAELARCRSAYRELNASYTLLLRENQILRLVCENLTAERDHWRTLYQNLSSQLPEWQSQVDYWRSLYESTQSQLQAALASIGQLSAQLAQSQSEAQHWLDLYLSTQFQLQLALVQVEYWRDLYHNLANISVEVAMGNITVETRCVWPYSVSTDILVCVSSTETPIYLVLEYWAESSGETYGYGSHIEDVSTWEGNCKTFPTITDFGTGLEVYNVVARASLRPLNGLDQAILPGPP
jgi:hypothetical protein